MTPEEVAERDASYANHWAKNPGGSPKVPPKNGYPSFPHPAAVASGSERNSAPQHQTGMHCPMYAAGNCRFGQNCKNFHDSRHVSAAATGSNSGYNGIQMADWGQVPYPQVMGYQSYI